MNTLNLVIQSVQITGTVNGQDFVCTSIDDVTRYIEAQYARLKTDESRSAMLAGFSEGKIAPEPVSTGPIPDWVLKLQENGYFIVEPVKELTDNNRVTNYLVKPSHGGFFKKTDKDHIESFVYAGLIAVSFVERIYDEELDAERIVSYTVRKAQDRKKA